MGELERAQEAEDSLMDEVAELRAERAEDQARIDEQNAYHQRVAEENAVCEVRLRAYIKKLEEALDEIRTKENVEIKARAHARANEAQTTVCQLGEQRDALERELRETLWLQHGCVALYGDDGEMQCGACHIDFKREPLEDIRARLLTKALDVLRGE